MNGATLGLDLAMVVPALNKQENLELLLPALRETLQGVGLSHEIVGVVGGSSQDGTREAGKRRGGRLVIRHERGCGEVLLAGFAATTAPYMVTTSRIIQDLPEVIGMDVLPPKLRLIRDRHSLLVQGNLYSLPFRERSFETVTCSEVVDHLPAAPEVVAEMTRVLRPEGTLILGTPIIVGGFGGSRSGSIGRSCRPPAPANTSPTSPDRG